MNERLVDPHTGEELELATPPPASGQQQQEPQPALSPLQLRQQEWSRLPVGQQQLLRLAALPADRTTGLRPLLFVSLEKTSKHSKEVSLLRLDVKVPGSQPEKGVNQLELWVDHLNKEITFSPDHGVVVSLPNRGLGRFLLATAIGWCSPAWASYRLQPIDLKSQLVSDDAARLRRDHALQAQGFTLTYVDAVQMSAVCNATRLEQLHGDWNREKIRAMDNLEVAQLLHSSDMNLKAQTSQINQLLGRIELLKRDDNTLRFTILTLIFFAIFQAGLLIWMATR